MLASGPLSIERIVALKRERDEARAIARRLAASLSADSTRNEQLSALDAFDALPWAKED